MTSCCKIILWTSPKHSGKTTVAFELAEKAGKSGFNVAGILAPAIYESEKLTGFSILDIQNSKLKLFAYRKTKNKPFSLTSIGLKFGQKVLSNKAIRQADLIIIDEFGPLELAGKGWRKCVDKLISTSPALLLLVVRKELVKIVEKLYKNLPIQNVNALNNDSIKKVLTMLKKNVKVLDELKKHLKDKEISCANCFKISDKLNVPLKTVGRLCDENNIRIRACQLGCFE